MINEIELAEYEAAAHARFARGQAHARFCARTGPTLDLRADTLLLEDEPSYVSLRLIAELRALREENARLRQNEGLSCHPKPDPMPDAEALARHQDLVKMYARELEGVGLRTALAQELAAGGMVKMYARELEGVGLRTALAQELAAGGMEPPGPEEKIDSAEFWRRAGFTGEPPGRIR